MDQKKRGMIAVSLLAVMCLLASCGSSAARSVNGSDAGDAYSGGAAYGTAEAAVEEAADADWEEDSWEDSVAYAADEDVLDTSDDYPADTDSGEYKNLDKIVYSCSADLQTLEYDKSVADLRAAVKTAGGIIESETESDSDYNWYYDDVSGSGGSGNNRNLYLTVRIPTDRYEEFVASLEAYGKVMNKTQSADNISKTYNDKKTYIASLETEQKRLLEMMDSAETIEDMMAVEQRLTEVQRQLNQYKTDLEAMDLDIAYSTVTLNLQEVQKISNEPSPGDSFGTRLKKAFTGAWSGFAEFCQNFLLAVIYLLPAILVTGAIVVLVLFATRKRRRARKEKKETDRAMFEDLKQRAQKELQDRSDAEQ